MFESYIMENPRVAILVFAAVITLFISIVNFFILDKEKMRGLKARQKEIQKEIKALQKEGKHDAAAELTKELLASSGEMLRHSFKPLLITIVPVLLLFNWVRASFVGTSLESSWFWWYLFGAIVFSIIFRKLLKLP